MSDTYDPDAPEDRPSSQHISKKDLRIIGPILLVLAIAAYPIYLHLLKGVHQSVCRRQLKRVGSALIQYVTDYDDYLPFAYETQGYNSNEIALRKGVAYTWHWPLKQYTGTFDVFKCPAAHPEENSRSSDNDTFAETSYGMPAAYSGLQYSTIASPNQKFIILETSKNGSRDTYDPLPLTTRDSEGRSVEVVDDGFLAGFNNEQVYPSASTRFATRLAFPNSWPKKEGDPVFKEDSEARHPDGLHFVFLDTSIRRLDARAAQVSQPFGPWDVPKSPLRASPTLPRP